MLAYTKREGWRQMPASASYLPPRGATTAARLLLSLALLAVSPLACAWSQPRSGYEFLPPQLQAMQDDPFENPGMFTVDEGREAFRTPGYNGKACSDCHGRDGEKLDPMAIARYPIYSAAHHGPLTLQQRINDCRENHMAEFPQPYDDPQLVNLETYVRHLAKGEKVNVQIDGPLRPYYEAVRTLYHTRIGQLDISCAHCHDTYQGTRLRDQVLNQGQSNGFPTHRLITGSISSLHRKLRDCFATLRAMPYPPGSEEFINLEVYMNARGNGLPIETPAIRR